jgi:hypothetical protein
LRAALLPALFALACGPVSATSVIGDAELATARAHAADGDKYAQYDTTMADLCLQKAREEQGHAHYSDAEELADESLKHAREATRKAAERRNAAVNAPQVPTATIQRPVMTLPPAQPRVSPTSAPAAKPESPPPPKATK